MLCGDSRGRGSKTEDFLRFLRCARDPLRRSCASKRSRCGAVRICLSLGEPSAEIVRVEALLLWRRAIFSPLVRGSSGLKIAAFKYNRSTRSVWKIVTFKCGACSAAQAGKSQLLSANVVRGAHPRSSGLKIATFTYKRSTRSVLLQLRVENRNF